MTDKCACCGENIVELPIPVNALKAMVALLHALLDLQDDSYNRVVAYMKGAGFSDPDGEIEFFLDSISAAKEAQADEAHRDAA